MVIGVATGAGFQTPRSWPPDVQPVSADSPVLSPAEELKTIYMPPGYHLELVASEPLVQDPVVIDWDPDGRLWVVEMAGYMNDIQATGEHESARPGRRPRGHQQRWNDGQAHGLRGRPRPAARAEGARARRARRRAAESLADEGHERRSEGRHQGARHRMLTAGSTRTSSTTPTRCCGRSTTGSTPPRSTLILRLEERQVRGAQDAGARAVGRLAGRCRTRVPELERIGAPRRPGADAVLRAQSRADPHARQRRVPRGRPTTTLNTVWPVRPTRGVNRGYQVGDPARGRNAGGVHRGVRPDGVSRRSTPSELYGNVFVAEPAGNLVSRIVVTDDGQTLRGRKAYERGEFIASTDERFRPVYLSSAPDGTLYVVDMYRGIVQHRGFITEYLRDQILSRHAGAADRSRPHLPRRPRHDAAGPHPALSKAAPAARSWICCRIPTAGGATPRSDCWSSATTSRRRAAASSSRPAARGRRGRGCMRCGRSTGWTALAPADVTRALGDASRDVRVSAVRLSERWLRDGDAPMQAAVLALVGRSGLGGAGTARRVARRAAGRRQRSRRLRGVLERNASDPVAMDAALSGLAGERGARCSTRSCGTR